MDSVKADLQALLERVERAEGPDRELDAAIAAEIGEEGDYPGSHLLGGFSQGRAAWLLAYARPYTASVDVALALVERVLPDANCVGFDKTPRSVDGYVSRNNVGAGHWLFEVTAATPALALVAALLTALIASPASPADRQETDPGKPENETPRERAG